MSKQIYNNSVNHAEIDKYILSELQKRNIPSDSFNAMLKVVEDFYKDNKPLREQNHSVYYILMLSTVFEAGKEYGINERFK